MGSGIGRRPRLPPRRDPAVPWRSGSRRCQLTTPDRLPGPVLLLDAVAGPHSAGPAPEARGRCEAGQIVPMRRYRRGFGAAKRQGFVTPSLNRPRRH